jgi:hypothetical protein
MTTPIPSMVQAIARSISARLPADEAAAFDAAVAAAAAGRDLSRVPWRFLVTDWTADAAAAAFWPAWTADAAAAAAATRAAAAAEAHHDITASTRRQAGLLLQLLADQERIDG